MKTSKKILMIVSSLTITGLISASISGAVSLLGIPFWPLFWFICVMQIIIPQIWDKLYESKVILKHVKEYNSKPYKRYEIPLNCAHCGSKNVIEIDLMETEFRCNNCQKFNGIHVNFMTAAITEPINIE